MIMNIFESNNSGRLQGKNPDAVKRNEGAVDLQPGILCVDYLNGSLRNILYRSKVTDYGRYFDFVFNYINVGGY